MFDLDDTLTQTFNFALKVHTDFAAKYLNYKIDTAKFKSLYGKPYDEFLTNLYPPIPDRVEFEKQLNHFRFQHDFKSHENVPYLLKKLKEENKYLGIITAATSELTERALNRVEIDISLFEFIHGSDLTPFHKPDPRVFDLAKKWMSENTINPNEAVYIGDGINDYKAARDTGLDFLAVLTGNHSESEFLKLGLPRKYIFKNLSSIINTEWE